MLPDIDAEQRCQSGADRVLIGSGDNLEARSLAVHCGEIKRTSERRAITEPAPARALDSRRLRVERSLELLNRAPFLCFTQLNFLRDNISPY